MLVHEGEERTAAIDIRLAAMLSAIAGGLNTAGFHAVGYFSANMTGNVSALSDYLGLGNLWLAALFGSIVVAFILGAFFSGLLIEMGRQRGIRAIYAYSIAAEGGLLVALGVADLFIAAVHSSSFVILGLSFLMGLQNAATTRISSARVRTTHVSGMATDIGLGLAALFNKGGASAEVLHRLRLHCTTILAFFLGGIAGVVAYQAVGGVMLLISAALLLLISIPEVLKARASA